MAPWSELAALGCDGLFGIYIIHKCQGCRQKIASFILKSKDKKRYCTAMEQCVKSFTIIQKWKKKKEKEKNRRELVSIEKINPLRSSTTASAALWWNSLNLSPRSGPVKSIHLRMNTCLSINSVLSLLLLVPCLWSQWGKLVIETFKEKHLLPYLRALQDYWGDKHQ